MDKDQQTGLTTMMLLLSLNVPIFVALPLPELHLCDNPAKYKPCALCCTCLKYDHVIFYKENGSDTGVGVCVGKMCSTNDERYSLNRNSSGTYLNILHLQRDEDEDIWSCECGVDRSQSKKLTVFTRPSTITIETVPSTVNKKFTITAVGDCVYPNNVTARLLTSQGYSNHRPVISYTVALQCDPDEREISASFVIKPTDFLGDVTFRVEIKIFGEDKSFISDSSNKASFQVSDDNYATIIAAIVFISVAVVVIALLFVLCQWQKVNCIQEADRFGGGSVMMWAVISRTRRTELVHVNDSDVIDNIVPCINKDDSESGNNFTQNAEDMTNNVLIPSS